MSIWVVEWSLAGLNSNWLAPLFEAIIELIRSVLEL